MTFEHFHCMNSMLMSERNFQCIRFSIKLTQYCVTRCFLFFELIIFLTLVLAHNYVHFYFYFQW